MANPPRMLTKHDRDDALETLTAVVHRCARLRQALDAPGLPPALMTVAQLTEALDGITGPLEMLADRLAGDG